MIPHERSLVQKLSDKPFALIGVNSDKDKDEVKKRLADERMTWRHFFDGGSTEGPIATRWNVSGWPTTYVIDAAGVIRHKDLRDQQAEDAIVALLDEMAKAERKPAKPDADKKQ